MSTTQTRTRRSHSPPSMYSGLAFLGLPPSREKKVPQPHPSPKPRPTKSSSTLTCSVKSAPSMDNMTTPSPASSVFKTIRRSIVLSKSMEFTFKKGNKTKGKEKASDASSNKLGCSSFTSPVATLSSRRTSVAELPTLDFGPESPVICISRCPYSSPSSSSGAGSPDTIWNSPSTSSSAVVTPPAPSTTLPSVTIAIPEEGDKCRRDSSCTTTTTISSMVFCYPDPDAVRRRPTISEGKTTDEISHPKLTVDIPDKSTLVTKPLLDLLSPPRLQRHARSSSTPSVSHGWSSAPLSREEDKENEVGSWRQNSVQVNDDDEDDYSSPPSPLVFARRSSSDTDEDRPPTLAFPELPPFMGGQPKKLGRSRTVSHLTKSNPNLGRRRHVDLGAIEPEPSQQVGHGWTGRWNRRDMQDVIQSLRSLK